MQKPAARALSVLLFLGGAACGDPESARREAARPLDALEAAADKAAGAGSARMTMTIDAPGETFEVDAEGAFDFDDELAEMTMTMTGGGVPPRTELDMVLEGDYMYMKLPRRLAARFGSDWVRMDLTNAPGLAKGQDVFSQDPSQMLDLLRGATDDVEEVGTETVRGVAATRYRASLSLDKMLDQAPNQEAADRLRSRVEAFGGSDGTIPCDVWIDRDGLPRRMSMALELPTGGAMTMVVEVFDYGVEVDAEVPEKFEELPL